MKRLVALVTCVLLLNACTTVQSGASKAGAYLCANKESLMATANLTLVNAAAIENVAIRAITIAGAQGMLAALSTCSVAGAMTPPGVVGG